MRKRWYPVFCMMLGIVFAAGCGVRQSQVEQSEAMPDKAEEIWAPSGENGNDVTIEVEYAQAEPYPALAQFLADYYMISGELLAQTRYYYNRVDLDDDGDPEIFAMIIGEKVDKDIGNPALILKEKEGDFQVLDTFEEIRTPILICDTLTNGWHDILFETYGKGIARGYVLYVHGGKDGYRYQENQFFEEKPAISGTQILSNNLIDDMDQGNYFTLQD